MTTRPSNSIQWYYTPAYDKWMALACAVALVGVLTDLAAHFFGLANGEPFLTPWHVILYGGLISIVLLLLYPTVMEMRREKTLAESIPWGYKASFYAIPLVAIGGIADAWWHNTFGVEQTVEALFSPPHLIIGIALITLLTGPFRAMCQREQVLNLKWFGKGRIYGDWPGLVSFAMGWFVAIGGMTHYASLLAAAWYSESAAVKILDFSPQLTAQILTEGDAFRRFTILPGAMGVVIGTFAICCVIATLGRRYVLPFGFWMLLFGLQSIVGLLWNRPGMIFVGLFIGFLFDVGMREAMVAWSREVARQACVIFPMVYVGFVMVFSITDNHWLPHAIFGMVALAGFFGFLSSLFLIPPDWLQPYQGGEAS